MGLIWHFIEPLLVISESFSELFFSICSQLNEHQQANFAMLLWSIWKRRNNKLWNQLDETIGEVSFRALTVLDDWNRARPGDHPHSSTPNSVASQQQWQRPPEWLHQVHCGRMILPQ